MLKSFKTNVTSLVKSAKQTMNTLRGNVQQKATALSVSVTGRMHLFARTQTGLSSIETVAIIIVGLVLVVMFVPQAKELITVGFTKAKGWLDQIS